jgi:rubrerythrin
MLDKSDKLISYIGRIPFDDLRAAWIARCRAEHDRLDALETSLLAGGMERVDADGPITSDGREVMHIRGRAYALRADVHAERLAQRFESSKKRHHEPEARSVAGSESLSAMVCPKCGDILQHTAVCPKCAAGKLGYRHRYTCVCGGVDLISKEVL